MSALQSDNKVLFLDFEFNQVSEPKVNLVCCATFDPSTQTSQKVWLHKNPKGQREFAKYLKQFKTFYAYSVVAEARSFIALGLDPLQFEWVDLFLEYRCLTNHNDRLQWGWQLVKGRKKFTKKPLPKWEREKGVEIGGFAPTHSLAEATFKLTKQVRDVKEKDAMRDLIISNPERFTDKQKEEIMNYCLDDVIHLPELWSTMKKEYRRLLTPEVYDAKEIVKEAKVRGRYSAITSLMENYGYPINVEKTKNFSRQVPNIIYDMQDEINKLFPDIKPFRWNAKEGRFSENQGNIKDWIQHKSGHFKSWPKTDSGAISLALDSFTKFYNFAHDYPKDNFGAQMVRYGKLKQNIYGFNRSKDKANKEKKNFWDSVGSDGRVRPYLNIYKAQSSRSQPAATSFMFLKPAWMRALVEPAPGKFMAGIDYASQEFFLSALLSGDQNMISSYLSGDPYLAFGKLSGQIPKDGTKETHKFERDCCKSTVLGISYMMTKYGLAIKLTADSGRVWTEEEAQEQIDMFYEVYDVLHEFQQDLLYDYEDLRRIKLPCGWYMWGDNENFRSVANMLIQGTGASIMRMAVDLATKRGVYVPFTLHDAVYMEANIGEEWKIAVLRDAMREAFVHYIREDLKDTASKIRLDPFAWSPDYKKDSQLKVGKDKWEVPSSNLYIDERAIKDYQQFSRYFNTPDFDIL